MDTGKPHLATAIGIEACRGGKSVRFFHTGVLENQLGEAQKQGDFNRCLKQLATTDLAICDEWEYVPLEQKAGSNLLF